MAFSGLGAKLSRQSASSISRGYPGILSRALELVGTMGLIVSACLPWFRLRILPGIEASRPVVTSYFDPAFRFLYAIAGLASAAMIFRITRASVWRSWLGLALLLLISVFPCAVMLWDPTAATMATTLQASEKNVLREVALSLPDQMYEWKLHTEMTNIDRSIEVVKLRIPNAEFFTVANVDRFVEGIGFSNDFLNYMGWAVPIAIASCLLLLSSPYLRRDSGRFQLLQRQVVVLLIGFCVISAFVLAPLFVSNYLIDDAQILAAQGLYADALSDLDGAKSVLPSMSISASYQDLRSQIIYHLARRADPGYYLHLGNAAFDAGRFEEAVMQYREALRIGPQSRIARYDLSVALSNLGVRQYGQGQYADAISSWTEALHANPGNVKPLFELQIAYLQVADVVAARQAGQAFLAIEEARRLPSLGAVGQAYVHLSWCAFQSGDYGKAFEYYRQAVEPTLW